MRRRFVAACLLGLLGACGAKEAADGGGAPGADGGTAAVRSDGGLVDGGSLADGGLLGDGGPLGDGGLADAGTRDAGAGGVRAITSLDDFFLGAAESVCAALLRCCSSAGHATFFSPYTSRLTFQDYRSRLPPNVALSASTCPQLLAEMYSLAPLGARAPLVDAGLTFDAAGANACQSELASAACGLPLVRALTDPTCFGFDRTRLGGPFADRRMFRRTAGIGSSCSALSTEPGDPFGTCDPTLGFCCQLRGNINCTAQICRLPALGETGTCRAVAHGGGACDSDGFCLTTACDIGSYCTNRVCGAPPATGFASLSDGQPCNENGECVSGFCVATRCAASTVCGTAVLPDGGTSDGGTQVDGGTLPALFAVDTSPYGQSFSGWIAEWSRWILSIPAGQNPGMDSTGANCATGQSGMVWYLSGTFLGAPVQRSCTIPSGKALFFPIATYVSDYPCPDVSFQPASGQTLEAFLTADAASYVNQITAVTLAIDGIAVPDPRGYRAHSSQFDFTAHTSLTFDSCFTYSAQPGVADGFWIMVPPLASGAHTLHFTSTSPFGGQDIRYSLTVQ